jgi:uncharacterized damage-inducible protein DinB
VSDAVVGPVERPDPPPAAGEKEMLAAFLDYHRATLLWKCEGLTVEQLKQRSVPPSTLSLLGLVRHMTDVERGWFRRGVGGEKAPPLLDYDADPEADFDQVDAADAAEDIAAYRAEIELCRQAVERADSLDTEIERDRLTVRWVLCHMLEEYARHNGHADLLRQAIDGATGE